MLVETLSHLQSVLQLLQLSLHFLRESKRNKITNWSENSVFKAESFTAAAELKALAHWGCQYRFIKSVWVSGLLETRIKFSCVEDVTDFIFIFGWTFPLNQHAGSDVVPCSQIEGWRTRSSPGSPCPSWWSPGEPRSAAVQSPDNRTDFIMWLSPAASLQTPTAPHRQMNRRTGWFSDFLQTRGSDRTAMLQTWWSDGTWCLTVD